MFKFFSAFLVSKPFDEFEFDVVMDIGRKFCSAPFPSLYFYLRLKCSKVDDKIRIPKALFLSFLQKAEARSGFKINSSKLQIFHLKILFATC